MTRLIIISFLIFFTEFLFGNNPYIIKNIKIEGNKITKEQIITREIPFKINDTIPRELLTKKINTAEENILNLSLFNFVFIVPQIDTPYVEIRIIVKERWYTFPYPIFEVADRNINAWLRAKRWDRINYGLELTQENCRGRKETLKLLAKAGYNQEYGFSYEIPYINKSQKLGFRIAALYDVSHELYVNAENNKLIYFKSEEETAIEKYAYGATLLYRSGFYHTLEATLGFSHTKINPYIISRYPNFFLKSGNSNYPFFFAKYKNDHRNIKSYPLKGYYYDFEIYKDGTGLLSNNPDILYLKSAIRKYLQFDKKWYFSIGAACKISSNQYQPYYFQKSLGYDNDFVRGYQYYIIDGQHFILGKTNLKYELIPKNIIRQKWLPFSKFNTIHYAAYLNIFFDSGYSKDYYYYKNNPLNNTWLYGTGIGLDFVTYYDKVIRIEWALNKKKESGIFIHLVAPI